MVFWPEILVWWWGPMKVFCSSVNAHVVGIVVSGGGDTSPLHVVIKLFSFQVVGTLIPSIEYASLPFAPLCSPLLPFAPLHSLHSLHPLSSPLPPFASLCPLTHAPTEVVGTLKPSIEYALLPFIPLPPNPLPPQRWWGP